MASENTVEIDSLTKAVNRCWLSIKYAARRLLAMYEYDLTMEQLMVLFILNDRDGQNLRKLAEVADRERTTMTRMIDGLEKRNLVVRVPDQNDGRHKLVYLTKNGRQVTAEVHEHAAEFEKTAYSGLTQAQLKQATEVLIKVSQNLGYEP